jgi:hypothetical protein
MEPQVKNGRIVEDIPSDVKSIHLSDTDLVSLEGCPQKLKGVLICNHNKTLKSLKGCPTEISCDMIGNTKLSGLSCSHSGLTSIAGIAKNIGGSLLLIDNELTSLEGLGTELKSVNGRIYIANNPVESHLLGALMVAGCTEIVAQKSDKCYKACEIINKYLKEPNPKKKLIECQNELIEAGYEDYAQV